MRPKAAILACRWARHRWRTRSGRSFSKAITVTPLGEPSRFRAFRRLRIDAALQPACAEPLPQRRHRLAVPAPAAVGRDGGGRQDGGQQRDDRQGAWQRRADQRHQDQHGKRLVRGTALGHRRRLTRSTRRASATTRTCVACSQRHNATWTTHSTRRNYHGDIDHLPPAHDDRSRLRHIYPTCATPTHRRLADETVPCAKIDICDVAGGARNA